MSLGPLEFATRGKHARNEPKRVSCLKAWATKQRCEGLNGRRTGLPYGACLTGDYINTKSKAVLTLSLTTLALMACSAASRPRPSTVSRTVRLAFF